MIFKTLNSTYELDRENSRIRRLEGLDAPTPRQGPDGEWKTYATLTPVVEPVVPSDETPRLSFFIDWDGEGHGTLTSPVQEVVADKNHEPLV